MERPIRVLIIHRNRLFREGLSFVLDQQQNITVVGSFPGAGEVVAELVRLTPDLILLDLCVPGREGLGEARLIRGVFPEVKILMMGLSELQCDVLTCAEAGVTGCLPKEASLEDLLNHIQAAATGEALCSPKVAGLLFSRVAEVGREGELRRVVGLPNLTRRELEVIALIEERLSNKEIAIRLQIEVQTVKNHIHNILEKLQLDGRREVAHYARERGLVPAMR